MPQDRLPPLNALKAFEAVARHMSFTKAAEELKVTPGAISQHIRTLEEEIGTPLFKRLGRQILLTDAAQSALPALREGFDRINDAARLMRQPMGRRSQYFGLKDSQLKSVPERKVGMEAVFRT